MSSPRSILLLVLPCLLLIAATPDNEKPPGEATPTVESPYLLQTSVVGAAGTTGTAPGIRTSGTLGQSTPVGVGTSANRILHAGFWKKALLIAIGAEPSPPPTYLNQLLQNYPNPFNPVTTIEYSVAEASPVKLAVYDVLGRQVTSLVDAPAGPGHYQIVWDGRSGAGSLVASGVYFYRIRIGEYTRTRKMLVLK